MATSDGELPTDGEGGRFVPYPTLDEVLIRSLLVGGPPLPPYEPPLTGPRPAPEGKLLRAVPADDFATPYKVGSIVTIWNRDLECYEQIEIGPPAE